MKLGLALLVLAMYTLHQDFWFWYTPRPLLLNRLPPGLWYHAIYTIACSALMALLVRVAWPAHLDNEDSDE